MAQIPDDLFKKSLLQLMEETFEHVHGIFLDGGTSLLETLRKVTPEEATRVISARGATISSHVGHVRYYLGVLERYIRGETIGKVDWPGTWQPKAVNGAEWDALQEELAASYRRIREMIEGLDAWHAENQIGGALAIVAHTAYHLGSIRLAVSGGAR